MENYISEDKQNKIDLAFFTKYQELRKKYNTSPTDNNLCGFVILNHRKENCQALSVSATQFGNLESMINTLVLALCNVTEQCSVKQQIDVSKQISIMFAKRASFLESSQN